MFTVFKINKISFSWAYHRENCRQQVFDYFKFHVGGYYFHRHFTLPEKKYKLSG